MLFKFRSEIHCRSTCLKILLSGLILSALVFVPQAQAVVVKGMYRVEFPVPDQTRAVRTAVFNKGLEEVLIRASGRRNILKEIKTGSASAYVQQYSYAEQQQPIADSGVDSRGQLKTAVPKSYLLTVEYNPGKIVQLLRDNNQPVWGVYRNQALMWLAVRDGTSRYVLKDTDNSLLKDAADDSMQRRGVPLVWPVYDKQDRNKMRFVDAWAAFEKPVKEASKRYTTGPVIVGRMSWNGSKWNGDWSLFVENASYTWTLSSTDYNALIAEAIDLSADEIGKHYAVLERQGINEPGLLIEVGNIDSVEDFRAVQTFLNKLTAVRQTSVSRVENNRVEFVVDLRGDMNDFVRQVSTDRALQPVVKDIQPGTSPEQSAQLKYLYRQ